MKNTLHSLYQVKKVGDSIDWTTANLLSDFIYPWREEPPPATFFRALWDEEHFHFRFEAVEDDLHTYADTNEKMEVVFSDRVEIFFRRNKKMRPYYCLEMDAAGRVLDYRADFHRQFDYQWRWGEGLMVNAQMTPAGYQVTGRITLESLKGHGLLRNGQLEAGLFRANCVALEGKKADFKWISWIDPKTEKPDFHVPAAFGVLRLMEE